MGREVLATVLDHRSGLELVGVKVYSDDKDGVDAGVLVGRAPVGVEASTDTDRILALDADCVVYTPRLTDLDEVCAILASGKNVVTTAFLFHPDRLAPDDRDRLLAACHAGGTSIHGGGLNPGVLSGALPLAMAAMSRTIDRLTLQERADWSVYDSTAITFDNMRFGSPIDEIDVGASEFLAFNSAIFTEQVWLLADALHAGIDEVTATVEAVAAEHDHQIFDHLLQGGHHRGSAVELDGPSRRRAARRDRDTLDGRQRVPEALAEAQARVDADHRGRPVDADPLHVAGQLRTGRADDRARQLRERRHGNGRPERGARGVRGRAGVRDPGVGDPAQPDRLRQLVISCEHFRR